MSDYDLILVGGGLANSLLALRLRERRPTLRLALLEQSAAPCGNHTWSWHAGDLDPAQQRWLAPWVGCSWPRYRVRFPHHERLLESGYASIFSSDLAAAVGAVLGDGLRTLCPVTMLTPTTVTLADGSTLRAAAVIDGRGAAPSPHLALGWQAFVGQEWELAQPHGLDAPVIMDATVAQGDGYRFVYLLPFSATTLLIEDTHYVDAPGIDTTTLRQAIADYAASQGWQLQRLRREEQGLLPITLAGDFRGFWNAAAGQPRSGLRAGLFHPTTGYSLPHAVRLAWELAELAQLDAATLHGAIHRFAQRQWRREGYFRLLNRMLFRAGRPDQRWRVMERFYRLPAGLIARFYAGRLTLGDQLRIVAGKPPVPVGAALAAARRHRPEQLAISGRRS